MLIRSAELAPFPLSRLRERVGVRASLNQRLKNALQHRFGPLKHFVVPEPNHAKSAAREIARALEIFEQTIRVLPAIELDDQPRSHANEIHDVPAKRHLPPESIAAQAADCAGSARGSVRHRSNSCAARVRSTRSEGMRKTALTLPSPASGRGEERASALRWRVM